MRAHLVCFALTGCMGGAVSQSPACAAYVECIQAQDAAQSRTTNLDRFIGGGSCWVNSETAELCTSGCERGLEWIKTRTGACTP